MDLKVNVTCVCTELIRVPKRPIERGFCANILNKYIYYKYQSLKGNINAKNPTSSAKTVLKCPSEQPEKKHPCNTHAAKRHASTTWAQKYEDTLEKFIKFSGRGYLWVVLVVDTAKMRTTYIERKVVR